MAINLEQNLSPNFKLREMLISETAPRLGITEQYTPSAAVINNLTQLCVNILQPLRDRTRKGVNVTSGYRCKRVNTAIGGAKNSQHLVGQAADINVPNKSTEELYQYLKASGLPFDQLIQEFDNWVHISYNPALRRQRGQCLRAVKIGGQTAYQAD